MSNYAIYQPKGAAKEYAEWACNFYVGCSNNCSYCYLKKGIGAKVLGGCKPELKKCFKDEGHAFDIFEKEVISNKFELQQHGLFFSFTTDPMLPETIQLTLDAIEFCYFKYIPVKILTKCTGWVDDFLSKGYVKACKSIAIGFTLTGHDELEPNASPNYERIDAIRKLHEVGFKTFCSIEPIIHFESSLEMIRQTVGICDLWKIGLESGKKYSIPEMYNFVKQVNDITAGTGKVYLKDSITNILKPDRFMFPANFVNRDYNLFQ